MQRKKHHIIFLNIILYILMLSLNFLKVKTNDIAIEDLPQDIIFFLSIILETVTILFNITLLHWLYRFIKLNIDLSKNIMIYLIATTLGKLFIFSNLVSNLIFAVVFIFYNKNYLKLIRQILYQHIPNRQSLVFTYLGTCLFGALYK